MKNSRIAAFVGVLALSLVSGFAFSQPKSSDDFVEVTVSEYIPCASEWAVGTVTLHAFQVYNQNGKIFKSHAQPVGARLTGQITGVVYHAVGVSQIMETASLNGEASTVTGIDNFHLVGTGKFGEKYKIYLRIKHTINSNGDVTADIDRESTSCSSFFDIF